jgi:hypothetical protein
MSSNKSIFQLKKKIFFRFSIVKKNQKYSYINFEYDENKRRNEMGLLTFFLIEPLMMTTTLGDRERKK